MNNLDSIEEFDIMSDFTIPHLLLSATDTLAQKKIALSILKRKPEEFLLMNSTALETDFVFAGITLAGIQYIAINGPADYKESLLEATGNKETMEGVLKIAKAMDRDLGEGATQNQQRVRNVIQYIRDNQAVFQF